MNNTVEGWLALQRRSHGHEGMVALGKLNSPTRLSYVSSLSNSSLCTCFKTEVVNIGLLVSPFIFGHPSFQFLLKDCFNSTCTHPALVLPSYWHKATACHHSDHFSRKAAFLPHYFRAIVCSIVVGPSLVVCLLPGHMTVKKKQHRVWILFFFKCQYISYSALT